MQIPFYFYLNLLALILCITFKGRTEKKIVHFTWYLFYCFSLEVSAWVYSYLTYRSNHWIYNLYTTGQIIFLSLIYSQSLVSGISKKAISVFSLLYPILVLLNVVLYQSFFKFHTLTYTLGCLFIIALIFAYFNQLLHSEEISSLRKNPFFWFNIGNAIYLIGSIFYLGSVNFILETRQDNYGELINIFVYSFTSVQYIFFIIAIACNLRPAMS